MIQLNAFFQTAILINMGVWVTMCIMKTTIDISDHLLQRAKDLAQDENTSLKEITEQGLELVIEKHLSRSPYVVKPVVFNGRGLSSEFKGKSWAEIRNEIYKGYGS